MFPASGDRDVTLQEQLAFERKGHVCVRGVLSNDEAKGMVSELIRETKARQLEAYRHRIAGFSPDQDPTRVQNEAEALDAQETLGRGGGFLQTFNCTGGARRILRDRSEQTTTETNALPPCAKHPLAPFGEGGGRAARRGRGRQGARVPELRVRETPGFGETHWHSDANMVPLDVNKFVTLWLPLRPCTRTTPLVFASGSHRDFAPPYWKTLEGMSDLNDRGYEVESYPPLDLGDVTAHAGWTLHWSPPQPRDCPPRYALSVCYFLDGARRLRKSECRQDPHKEDEWSYKDWLVDIEEGAPARHPALPVVYP